jgi:hypothetical protein
MSQNPTSELLCPTLSFGASGQSSQANPYCSGFTAHGWLGPEGRDFVVCAVRTDSSVLQHNNNQFQSRSIYAHTERTLAAAKAEDSNPG